MTTENTERRKLIVWIFVLVVVITAGIIVKALFFGSEPSVPSDVRSMQEQMAEEFLRQNENEPVTQADTDIVKDMFQE